MKNVVKLGDVCKIVTGSTPKSNVQEFWNGHLKWLTPAELDENSFIVYDTERKITFDGAKATGLKPFPAGTVILSSRAPIGKVAVSGCEMYCNQGFKNLICGSRIHNIYLYWFLKSKTEFLNSLGRGATFKEISKPIVENIDIPLPSYSQQESIAEQFNKIQKLIALCMEQHALLETLVKSRFIEMFGDIIVNDRGWDEKRLHEITTSRLGKMLDSKQQTGQQRYPYLANTNIQWFRIDLQELREMDFSESDRIEFELKEGDLLVCEGGEIGRCAIWHNEIKDCYFQKALHRVRCDRKYLNPCYLAYWFRINCDNDRFSAIIGSKATIAHLTGEKLKQLKVLVPPIELQNQFADFVTQVDKSKFDSSNLKFIHLNWLKEKFCRNILA